LIDKFHPSIHSSIFFSVAIIKFERMGPVQARPRPSSLKTPPPATIRCGRAGTSAWPPIPSLIVLIYPEEKEASSDVLPQEKKMLQGIFDSVINEL